jgi:antitoxin component of RelBE/YafQ-DinJ toxin-antitoxin module
MAKTAILRARVDCEKASAAEQIFSKLGITVGDAINILSHRYASKKPSHSR